MRRNVLLWTVLLGLSCFFPRARSAPASGAAPRLVLTTSMLECAAIELLGQQPRIAIVRLAPPGSCPGHFDLSPGIVPLLHKASLIVRHDYQTALDKKLRGLGIPEKRILSLACPDSLLIPDTYYLLLSRMADALGKAFPQRRPVVFRSLELARERLQKLTRVLRTRARPWQGASVVAARYQEEFCRWLGLRVSATFPRPEDMSPKLLRKVLDAPAVLIVANLQSGGDAAIALAKRKRIPAAVLSNFPGVPGFGTGYDALLYEDIRRLEQAWGRRAR